MSNRNQKRMRGTFSHFPWFYNKWETLVNDQRYSCLSRIIKQIRIRLPISWMESLVARWHLAQTIFQQTDRYLRNWKTPVPMCFSMRKLTEARSWVGGKKIKPITGMFITKRKKTSILESVYFRTWKSISTITVEGFGCITYFIVKKFPCTCMWSNWRWKHFLGKIQKYWLNTPPCMSPLWKSHLGALQANFTHTCNAVADTQCAHVLRPSGQRPAKVQYTLCTLPLLVRKRLYELGRWCSNKQYTE